MDATGRIALIVGAGDGLSASLARKLAARGARIALAARNVAKLSKLAEEIAAETIACDASKAEDVATMFATLCVTARATGHRRLQRQCTRTRPHRRYGPGGGRAVYRGHGLWRLLVGQQAARAMLERGHGTILFTGASASIKGFAQSAPFAMGKFALRGLAQSMARELGPKGDPRRACRHRWRDPQRPQSKSRRPAGRPSRSGRDCRDLSGPHRPAPQRLDPGAGGSALGREVLTRGQANPRLYPGVGHRIAQHRPTSRSRGCPPQGRA